MSEATSPLQSLLSAIGVRRSNAGLEPMRLRVALPVAMQASVSATEELPRPFRRPTRPKSVSQAPRSVCTTLKDLCEL